MAAKDSFAAMLLTMTLSPSKEEYARPYSTKEFHALEQRIRTSPLKSIGDLRGVDISGLMLYLDISEEEAYRCYTLLNRSVQMTYALDRFAAQGINILTIYDEAYPARLKRRMGDMAPACLFRSGNADLIGKPAVAVMGIKGVKTTPEVREGIERIVKDAVEEGYVLVTGGELGVSRVVANAVKAAGGSLVDVLGGDMEEHRQSEVIKELLSEGRMAVLTLEHPEAMFTVSHAIARNKVIFALSEAAVVCNTDNKRGELDAFHNGYCDWIYAWSGFPANQVLINRGIHPVEDLRALELKELSRHWHSSQSEQVSFFDLI